MFKKMATKSSIHIKPCNVASSMPHNRRTREYMRNIAKSRIYIVPELSAGNEQWVNQLRQPRSAKALRQHKTDGKGEDRPCHAGERT